MTINLFDDSAWLSLRPLTFTRPVANLRIGILTIAEKWEKHLKVKAGFSTQQYLAEKFREQPDTLLFINGSVCPDEPLVETINALKPGESLYQDAILLAYHAASPSAFNATLAASLSKKTYHHPLFRLQYPEDIFKNNDAALRSDFALLTFGRQSATLSSTNTLLGNDFFMEEGASAECSTFNSLMGPIYIGKNAQVWEGSHIRGSFALGANSQVKMGAKIYGQTTIGPFSRVGGEINNAVIWGYSSKGHEGYLGNAVIGQWCNLGADTNNSNLKNNYAEVKMWDYGKEGFRKTGLQFCGLVMADHVKCSINTMFNTGTVAGVGANIFGEGFPRNFVPDFSWGGSHGYQTYAVKKMFDTAEKVYERKDMLLDEQEKAILEHVFELTKQHRRF